MPSDAVLRRVRYPATPRADLLLPVLGSAVVIILIVGSAAVAEWDPVALVGVAAVLAVIAGVVVRFSSLTAEVDDEALRIAFGPGFMHYAGSLDRVQAWRAVRNPWMVRLGHPLRAWRLAEQRLR